MSAFTMNSFVETFFAFLWGTTIAASSDDVSERGGMRAHRVGHPGSERWEHIEGSGEPDRVETNSPRPLWQKRQTQ